MNRSLNRTPLSAAIVSKLKTKSIVTCKDLFNRNEYALMELLDISKAEVMDILKVVSECVVPKPKTALDMKIEKSTDCVRVATGLAGLDEALRGGLPSSSVTEIVGASGVGKSTFCLTVSCMAAISAQYGGLESPVVYIDTEDKFAAKRLFQIAKERFHCDSRAELDALASRCIVIKCANTQEFCDCLATMDAFLIEKQAKLLVLDSIAALVRREFDRYAIPQRQEFLSKQASYLKSIAENFQIPVLVSNQVTGWDSNSSELSKNLREGTVTAALGNTWAHCVNTRIALEESMLGRRMTIGKSPLCAVCCFDYVIDASGLQLQSNAQLSDSNHWSAQLTVTTEDFGAYVDAL